MLTLSDCCFSYGNHPILEHLSLSLEPDRPLALMAPSGRGKTTLLKVAAGLLKPQSGTVSGIPPQGAAFAFQEDRLLPWMTVRQNILLPSPSRTNEDVSAVLKQLGLGGWQEAFPDELSGGMARRVSLARALLFDSPLLLLDEPFRGLDEGSVRLAAECILRYSSGRMIMASLHNPAEAELLCFRIIRPFEP